MRKLDRITRLLATAVVGSSLSAGVYAQAAEHLLVSTTNPTTNVGEVRVIKLPGGSPHKTLTDPTWSPNPPIALDEEGHLAVLGVNTSTQTLYFFDRNYTRYVYFNIDTSGPGVIPSGPSIRSICFTPRGTILAAGGWSSAAFNYLFEIDPESKATLSWWNLDVLAGRSFEPSELFFNRSDGLVYLTEWSGPGTGQGEIAVFDPLNPTTFSTISTPVPAGQPLAAVSVLPGGSILFGEFNAGTLWKSDPTQTTWSTLQICPGGPNGFSYFAQGHSYAYADAGPCGAAPGEIWQIRVKTGAVQWSFSSGSGSSSGQLLIRH